MQQQQQVGSCSLCGCSNFAQNPWLKSHRCSNCQHEHDSPSFLPPAADGRNTPLATTTTAAAAAATNRGGRLGPVAAATARGGGRGAAGGRPSFRAVGGGITSTQTHPSSPSDKSDNGRHCESDPHPLGAPTGAEGSQTLLSACAASGGIGGNHRPLPPPPASFVAPQVSAFCSPTAATSSTNGSDQAPFLTTTAISSSDLQTHHSHQQQHQHHQQQLDEEMEEEESAEGLEATAHTHEKQVHSRVPEQQTPQDERTLPQMPRKTHRDHLATELVDSERIYVKNLALLIRTFLKPLRAGKHRLDMSTVLEPTFGLLGEVGSLGLDISTGGRGLQQGEGGEQSPQQDVRNDEHHHRASSTSMEERIESANPMTATASTNAELSHSMLMRTRSFTTSFFGKKEGEPLLSEEQITILCSNIEEIYGLNKILLKDLENRMESWDRNNTLIGDIFLELTPYLKNYVVYARMNEGAQTLLLELENNSSFVEFLHSWERLSIIRPGNLRSFLILPIQRIPRYELFLKDLVKHTQEDHPDYYNLCQALQKVKGVNHIINDNIRQAKNRLKIVELQHSLVKKAWQKTAIPQLVAAHRTFVKEGTLTKVCRSTHEQRSFVLLNDMLIYMAETAVSKYTHQKRYQFHAMLSLETLRVDDLPDRATASRDVKNAFKIVHPKKSFVVYADTKQDKEQWLSALRDTIAEWREKKSTLASSDEAANDPSALVEAPVWIPDEETNNCMLCTIEFTLTKRRHHCRSCGKIICGECSRQRVLLRNVSATPVRACNACAARLLPSDGNNNNKDNSHPKSRPILANNRATSQLPPRPAITLLAPSSLPPSTPTSIPIAHHSPTMFALPPLPPSSSHHSNQTSPFSVQSPTPERQPLSGAPHRPPLPLAYNHNPSALSPSFPSNTAHHCSPSAPSCSGYGNTDDGYGDGTDG